MDKRIGYEAIKRRKRRKKINTAMPVIVLLLVVSLVIFVIHERNNIITPAINFISDLKHAYGKNDKGGFPVTLTGSNEYEIKPYGDGFTLLTDTYLHIYASDGKLLKSFRHGFKNPRTTVADGGNSAQNSVLIYDKNYFKFALINAKDPPYEKHSTDGRQRIGETDVNNAENGDKIMLAALGNGDTAAIITNDAQYGSVLDVYNKERDKLVYRKRFTNENALALTLSGDAKYVYVATSGFENGEITCQLYKLDVDAEADYEWKTTLGTDTLPLALYNSDGVNYCVTDTGVYGVDDRGAGIGKYNWDGALKDFSFDTDTGASVYVVSNYVTGRADLESVDKNCRLTATLSATVADSDNTGSSVLRASKNGIFLLAGNTLLLYDYNLKEKRRETLDEEYTNVAVSPRSLYLLGFDTCTRLDI